jgi:CheY-like chemotaxis protein/ABC-type amino acid transport substrate-binding protein
LISLHSSAVLAGLVLSSISVSAQPLRIGYGNFPPYNFRNAQGQPEGFQIEVLNLAASRATISITWTHQPGLGIACLKSNLCDIWSQAATHSPTSQGFAVSSPWWGLQKAFLATQPANLKIIASLPSSSILNELKHELPNARISTFPTRAAAIEALCAKQVDSYFDSTSELINLTLLRSPSCQSTPIQLIPAKTNSPFGLAAQPSHAKSMQRLREEIDAMAVDGTLMQIASHYMLFADLQSYVSASQARSNLRRNAIDYTIIGLFLALTSGAFFIYKLKSSNLRLAEALDRAEASNRSKREFLAMISHELRTPMTGILGMIHLASGEPDLAKRSGFLTSASRAADSLLHILNDILDYSKARAGKLDLSPSPFHLPSLLEEITSLFQPALLGKHVALKTNFAPNLPPWILGDSARLRQVLVNLLGNSIKFTQEGEIRFAAKASNDRLQFEVADTGIGIPDKELASVFEAFTQVHRADNQLYGGTGLGLSICQHLVQLMRGTISVKSQLNHGTTFTVEMPFEVCPPAPAPRSKQQSTPSLSGLRILLAEDNPTNQRLFMTLLNKQGCLVTLAENGAQALELFHSSNFDVILLDVQMPIMDGLEAARQIRNQSTIPILGITAHASELDQQACLAAGMNDVLPKPILPDKLFAHIQQLMPQFYAK